MENEKSNFASRVPKNYAEKLSWSNLLREPVLRSAIRALQLPSGSRGLDAGCGIGVHTLWLAEAVAPDGHVIGLDLSPEFFGSSKGNCQEIEPLKTRFLPGRGCEQAPLQR